MRMALFVVVKITQLSIFVAKHIMPKNGGVICTTYQKMKREL